MPSDRRIFTPEFKWNLVQEARQDSSSVSRLARQYDVNTNQVFRWIREAKRGQARWVRLAKLGNVAESVDGETPTFLPVTLAPPTSAHSLPPCVTTMAFT